MKVQVSQLVRAPRERVFAAYADLESMPRWSSSAEMVRVIRRDGDVIAFEVKPRGSTGPEMLSGELVLTPPDKVRTEGESGRSKTKGVVTFQSVPEGTLVTSTIEVEIKGFKRHFIRPALGDGSKETAARNLSAFAKYVEGLVSRGAVES